MCLTNRADSARTQINSFTLWQKDLESVDEEEWTQALEVLTRVYLSPSQRLAQLFIVQKAQYTPQKSYTWEKTTPPTCPRCNTANRSLIHRLWR